MPSKEEEIVPIQSSPVSSPVSSAVVEPPGSDRSSIGEPTLAPLSLADHATIATQPTITIRSEPSSMSYIDGFLVPVSASNKEAYQEMARKSAALFKEFGATRVVECWGDDIRDGDVHDFKRAAKIEGDEVVVFSWIEYPSKSVRDAANLKMMTDPRIQELGHPMPFDMTRLSVGGFAPILDTHGEGR